MTIEENVKCILRDQILCSEESPKETDRLVDDLGFDSFDMVETVMALEDEFDIGISDEACESIKTVQDFIDLVKKLKSVAV